MQDSMICKTPLVTLSTMGLTTGAYFLANYFSYGISNFVLCTGPVFYLGEVFRMMFSTFFHNSLLHFVLMMAMLFYFGHKVEWEVGSFIFCSLLVSFAFLVNTMFLLTHWLGFFLTGDLSQLVSCSAGLSGVILALVVVDVTISANNINVDGSPVRYCFSLFSPQALVVVVVLFLHAALPNLSPVQTVWGLVCGFAYVKGSFKWLSMTRRRIITLETGEGRLAKIAQCRCYIHCPLQSPTTDMVARCLVPSPPISPRLSSKSHAAISKKAQLASSFCCFDAPTKESYRRVSEVDKDKLGAGAVAVGINDEDEHLHADPDGVRSTVSKASKPKKKRKGGKSSPFKKSAENDILSKLWEDDNKSNHAETQNARDSERSGSTLRKRESPSLGPSAAENDEYFDMINNANNAYKGNFIGSGSTRQFKSKNKKSQDSADSDTDDVSSPLSRHPSALRAAVNAIDVDDNDADNSEQSPSTSDNEGGGELNAEEEEEVINFELGAIDDQLNALDNELTLDLNLNEDDAASAQRTSFILAGGDDSKAGDDDFTLDGFEDL